MQLEAYALEGRGRRVALRSVLPLVSEDSARTWVQFAYEGEWEGHHAGSFEFTDRTFKKLLLNFSRACNPIPLTYEHPDRTPDGTPVVAAGWVHELRTRGDELWGLVEFTPRATKFVRNGEYKFVSVVVDFASVDRKSGDECGAELLEVGLTNIPFLDGMKPISLSRRVAAASTQESRMSDMDLVKAALKALGPDASFTQMTAWVEARKALAAVENGEEAPGADPELPAEDGTAATAEPSASTVAANAAPPLATPTDPPNIVGATTEPAPAETVELQDPASEAAGVDFAMVMANIATAAGLDEASMIALLQERAEEVGAFLAQLAAGQPDGTAAEAEAQAAMSTKLTTAQSQITKLTSQVKVLSDVAAEKKVCDLKSAEDEKNREAGEYVDTLIKAGKVLDTEREGIVKLALTDRPWVDKFVANREVVPMGQRVVDKAPDVTEGADGDDALRKLADYRAYNKAWVNIYRDPKDRDKRILSRLRARNITGRA